MLICSIEPLALLNKSLLSLGKDLSLTIIPSILKDVALLIMEPIFLGSVTSSKANNVRFFEFSLIFRKSFKFILSACSISAIKLW